MSPIPTPGQLVYRFHRAFKHGPATWYWRDIVRPRILKSPPFRSAQDGPCEIHVFTGENDWLNLIWTLASFYHHTGRDWPLCIHEDGTVPRHGLDAFRRIFPDARIILRADADREVLATLDAFPKARDFRATNLLAPKVFDFVHYLRGDRLFLIDSDILFFGQPAVLLQRLEDPAYRKNTLNADVAHAETDPRYTVDAGVVKERFGFDVTPRVNSGLGLLHRDSMRNDWIEEFLALPGIIGHFWRIEQTLIALCSCRYGYEHLPPEYDVQLQEGLKGLASRHFIGAIRHLMYKEGIRDLMGGSFAKAIAPK